MKKSLILALALVGTLPAAWGYEVDLAQSYERFYTTFSGADTLKVLRMISVEDFVKAVKAGEKLSVLDVRAPGETRFTGINLPNTITVSMDQVFKPGNLDRIPTDRKVVVVCKAGHRATAIAMSLRHVGFEQIYILNGGLLALEDYLSPKTAY